MTPQMRPSQSDEIDLGSYSATADRPDPATADRSDPATADRPDARPGAEPWDAPTNPGGYPVMSPAAAASPPSPSRMDRPRVSPPVFGPPVFDPAPSGSPASGSPASSPPNYGPPPEAIEDAPPAARTPRWVVIAIVAVVILIVLALLGATMIGRFGARGDSPAIGPNRGPAHTVSAPLGTRTDGSFELVTGATTVSVTAVEIGNDLYRIATPDSSSVVPRVVQSDNRVQLHLAKVEGDGTTAVTVQLNSRIRWQIGLTGGSASANVDLRRANLAAVDFTGGVTRIELWLPRPNGRVTARMAGGAAQFAVHAPAQIPLRVRVGNGAATVAIDGANRSGISPGTVFAPDGWDQAADRYDVDATAGVATFTVDRY